MDLTHDHIFVLIYNPYGTRQWASSSVRGGVGLFNAAGLCQLLYLGLPLVCLFHIEEAQALPPRQGSSPWGGFFGGGIRKILVGLNQENMRGWFNSGILCFPQNCFIDTAV
jgi:hypothetical protein